jgi:hypothetical protein
VPQVSVPGGGELMVGFGIDKLEMLAKNKEFIIILYKNQILFEDNIPFLIDDIFYFFIYQPRWESQHRCDIQKIIYMI